MRNDLQRVRAIEKFLKGLTQAEVQERNGQEFKVRIGAEYSVGKGEQAMFVAAPADDYTWRVTFKRSNRMFKAAWKNGNPVVCLWVGANHYCPQCGRAVDISSFEEDANGDKWATCGWCYEKVRITTDY